MFASNHPDLTIQLASKIESPQGYENLYLKKPWVLQFRENGKWCVILLNVFARKKKKKTHLPFKDRQPMRFASEQTVSDPASQQYNRGLNASQAV